MSRRRAPRRAYNRRHERRCRTVRRAKQMSSGNSRSWCRCARRSRASSSARKRSSSSSSSACSPAATACSKACPGSARRCSCARSDRRCDLDFRRIQFTPDLMPSDIAGTEILEEDHGTGKRCFRFQKGRCSRTCCSPTRSIARRRRRRPRCSRRCRSTRVSYGGTTYPLPRAVLRARDAEPDRAGGHVSAA